MKKIRLEYTLIFLVFLLLCPFASRYWLYYDDVMYGFPAVTNNYLTFYQFYIQDLGIFRPLALINYHYLYEILNHLPWLARLIPLGFIALCSITLYHLLRKQGLSRKEAIIPSLLFMTVPFNIEAVGWLSANVSLIVILIFFVQIYLIETGIFQKNLNLILLILQLAAIFLYETTIFMPLSLIYLLYIKHKSKNILKLGLLPVFPLIAYYLTKIAITPLNQHKDKLINVEEFIINWNSSFFHLKALFSRKYLNNFWGYELENGFKLISNNFIIFAILAYFVYLLTQFLYQKSHNIQYSPSHQLKHRLLFWLMSFYLSLIPLSWQPVYQPFRTLLLPFIILVIIALFSYKLLSLRYAWLKTEILKFIFSLGFILTCSFFILIQISLLYHYATQYAFDKKIALEINKKLESQGFYHPNRSNVLLLNFPYNNLGRIRYGDYLYGLYHYYWSAEAFLDLNSGSFSRIGVEFPKDRYFTARGLTKEQFLQLKPLTIMKYTNDETCRKSECLKVVTVVK